MRIAISTPTEAEYNELMEHLESKGYECSSLIADYAWEYYVDKTAIYLETGELDTVEYSDVEFYEQEKYPVIPYSELKANNFKIEIQL